MPHLQMGATCSSEPRIVGAARVCADCCWLPVSDAQPAHGAAKLGRYAMKNAAAGGAEGLKRHFPGKGSQYSPSWPTTLDKIENLRADVSARCLSLRVFRPYVGALGDSVDLHHKGSRRLLRRCLCRKDRPSEGSHTSRRP